MLDILLGSYTIEVREGGVLLPEMWRPKYGEKLTWLIIQDSFGDRSFWKMQIGMMKSALMDPIHDKSRIALQFGEVPVLPNRRLQLPAPFIYYLGGAHNVVALGAIRYFELWKDADERLMNTGFTMDDVAPSWDQRSFPVR